MHVVVVGCGRVGSALARQLIEAGNSVTVLDRNQEALERLGPEFPGERMVGIGFDRDHLIAAGIERATAVAAVTSGDNSNIMIARVARETFGIERVVARIYDPRRAAIYQRLGIVTVATVAWTTERVLRRITDEVAAVEWVDPSAKISLIERQVDRSFAGHRLLDLEDQHAGVRVVAVSRLGISQLPTPNLVAQEGDVLYLAVTSEAITTMATLFTTVAGGH